MWFSKTSFEMYISATVFYSTLLASDCGADDVPGGEGWKDNFVRIIRTEAPIIGIEFRDSNRSAAVTATVAILLVVASAAAIVCLCCCLCWKLQPRNSMDSRRQSHAALVPQVVRTVDRPNNGGFGRSTSRVGRGVMNLAFTSDTRDREAEDVPPAYTTVIMETSPNAKPANSLYHPAGDKKQAETPPPAYCTVAPKF